MRKKCSFLFFFLLLLPCMALKKQTPQERMLRDLDFIQRTFDVQYVPLEWKRSYHGVDIDGLFETARARIYEKEDLSLKEYQRILRTLFSSVCDYHVRVGFYSTEFSCLPFMVKKAGGSYFIVYIDREDLPFSEFPYKVGDELVTFGGKKTTEVVQEICLQKGGDVEGKTADELAEQMLTKRLGRKGDVISQGNIALGIKRKGEKTVSEVTLQWHYVPEMIFDFSQNQDKSSPLPEEYAFTYEEKPSLSSSLKSSIEKRMIFPDYRNSYVGRSLTADNPFLMGSRESFVPTLGKKVWTAEGNYFDAYIFETPSRHWIGYIRIPDYEGDEEEVADFIKCIEVFEEETDALVIDQINNPGGSHFYLSALLSCLTDKPLVLPKHVMVLTQEEVHHAFKNLSWLKQIHTLKKAKETFGGDTISGFPITMDLVKKIKQNCQEIIAHWQKGDLYTKPLALSGVTEILPHPIVNYTKPILVLANALDFSGGDFFPAVLQDNKRATIFGEKTAGAGGAVEEISFPNQNGIAYFTLTITFAERIDQNPLEDLGVVPDIFYTLSKDDLQNNYRGYKQEIVQAVEALIRET